MVGYSGNYQQFTPHPELIVKLFYLLLQRWQIQSFVNEHDKDPMQEWWWRHHCSLKKKRKMRLNLIQDHEFLHSRSWEKFFLISKSTIQKSLNGPRFPSFILTGPRVLFVVKRHIWLREQVRGQKRFASLQLFIARINKLRLTHVLIQWSQ
jgi:hypothetical protein